MARARKRHVQQTLDLRTWGGYREGAGRKQVNERKSEPHRVRPHITQANAIHVVLRSAPELTRLRRMDAFKIVRKAMLVVLTRTDFRIVHVSIQANHVHLLIEADSKQALAKGVQAFAISAARRLNAAEASVRGVRRRGPAFPDRYHAEVIVHPRRARNCLSYVLNNWRHHKEDRASSVRHWKLDKYSSAISFMGWLELEPWTVPEGYEPLPVVKPQSWLLREGWKRAGPISIYEEPK
jgi:REP element-mobilizing transposase RayT